MRYRKLGQTGLTVSEIGFGALGIGGLAHDTASYGPSDDQESLAALKRALEAGVTFYDTSPDYGDGHSEELIGQALGDWSGQAVIASKVGFVSLARPNDRQAIRDSLRPERIRASLQGSLRRLRRDHLDLLQLHSPPIEVLAELPEAVETLQELLREGTIRSWGISLRSPKDGARALEVFRPPVIQVNFSLIDQRVFEYGLFDLARERGTGIIVRTPFNFGFLTGKVGAGPFDPTDHRSRWSRAQLERWSRAAELFSSLTQKRSALGLALRFCLVSPAVSTVIPGMLRPVEVEENVRAVETAPLSALEIAEIRSIYQRHEFFVS